jgi:hypothetical protein
MEEAQVRVYITQEQQYIRRKKEQREKLYWVYRRERVSVVHM